jgi:Domain of unknown function (DUF4192)
MIPYIFGFTPAESLVLIALEGPRKRFGPSMRMDLVTDPADVLDQARYTAGLACRQGFRQVMVFGFGAAVEPAHSVLGAVRSELTAAGVDVLDAVRADGTRWWSLMCTNERCCPRAGTPYDVDSSRVAAEAVLAGLQRAPDRDSLRAQVAAVDTGRQAAVARAAAKRGRTVDVTTLVNVALNRTELLSTDEVAALASAVQEVRDRDRAWAMMSRPTAGLHFRLWRTVMQSVPDELLCPVGSLAAFAAWLSGSGVLASHAAERVLAVDPEYSMALLVVEALHTCLHPDSWESVRPLEAPAP